MPYGTHTYHDRGSWKKTLEEKAMFFEENTAERHNILGSYPSSVRLIPPKHYAGSQEGAWQQIIETGELPSGWTFDHGTTGLSNVAHTSSWAQGVGEFSHLRYRGGPSHHNYDHVFRGLGIYYFVAADDAQKEKVCEIVADMSFWAHLRNNMVAMHADGERISTELIGGWRAMAGDDRPSGGSVMALTGLKIAALITARDEVQHLYDTWVEKLGLRNANTSSIMGQARGNYDDTDHLLGDLYLLNRIEEDEVLRAFYRKCVKDSWEVHRDEKMAWFNYVYQAVLGDEYADTEGSLWNLQTHPTCRVFQPRMNSIRTDIEMCEHDGKTEALYPLPVYERASDNEYEWKGSPFQLDGWLSRTVSVLEVSPHDPYVQLAADEKGGAYWSNTEGEIWHAIDGLSHVTDFLFSLDYPGLIFAATSKGVYRTLDGGVCWMCVFDKPVLSLQLHPKNSHVLYATGAGGVYKSDDLGEQDMGTFWQCVSGHASVDALFAVGFHDAVPMLYRLTRNGFYRKAEGAGEWDAFPQVARQRGFSTVDAIGGSVRWLRVDQCGRLLRCVESDRSGFVISFSEDGGQTWLPVIRDLKPLVDWALGTGERNLTREELGILRDQLRELQMRDLRVDSVDADVWYGQLESGVAVTRDAGQTWVVSKKGLDIPRVHALWVPRYAPLVMVGTPAGMYVSVNQGEDWIDTSLILQEAGAVRSEIGGIGYLTAYWMGRYHGFVTQDDAQDEWWQEI